MLWLAAVVLPVLAGSAAAQPLGGIEGRIIDAETKQPLSRADVVVIDTERGTYTDREGYYKIDGLEPGSYNLAFSYISYEPVESEVVIVPSGLARVDQELVPSFLEGETIEVRPRFFVVDPGAPSSRVTLSREEIRRFPGGLQDVVRTVATLPGVASVKNGGRNDLLVRGGGPSENLYLINGIEVPNINHFGTQGLTGGALSFVNLDFVDQVEFATGGFGASHGDKLSSSLSIDLRPGRSDRLGGKATVSATRVGLNLDGPLGDRGAFLFSARQSYLDLLFRALGEPFLPIYTDFNLSAEFRPSSRYQLTLLGLAAFDRIERVTETSEDRVVNAGILDNTQDRWIGGLRLRHLLDRGFIDWTVGLNQSDFQLAQADTVETTYFRSDASERELSLRVDSFLRLPRIADLTVGGGVKQVRATNRTVFADSVYDRSGRKVPRQQLDLPGLINDQTEGPKLGLWIDGRRTLSRRLDLRAGLRFDHFDLLREPDYVAGRGSARYRVNDRWTLEASHGTYFQSPSYVWLANPTNRSLEALRNDMSVLGLEYLLRYDVNLSTEFYYKRYSDLPAGATEATSYVVLSNTGVGFGGREDDFQSFGYLPLDSTGEGRAYGIDLLMQKKFSESPFYGSLGLSIGRSEVTAPNGQTYPSAFDQRAILTLSGGYLVNSRWEVSGKWTYASGAPFTPVYDPATNGGVIQNLPGEYLTGRLPSNHSLDIRVDRRFTWRDWSVITFVDIQNVYNRRYALSPTWDFWNLEIVDREELGLFPTFGLSVEF